jgi:hypothetical protein
MSGGIQGHAGSFAGWITGDAWTVAFGSSAEREGYWWVQCAACDGGWQVLFYAARELGAS